MSPATTPTGTASLPINMKSNGSQNGNNGGGVIISPRYKEFKTYSSTFDGLQALEQGQTGIVEASNLAGAIPSGGLITNGSNLVGPITTRDVEEQQHAVRSLSGIGGPGKRALYGIQSQDPFCATNNKAI